MNKLMVQKIGLLYLVVERVPIGNPVFSYPHAVPWRNGIL